MNEQLEISLNITNNRDYPTDINIMGSPFNPLDTSNAKTEYRWDVTGFDFSSATSLSLQYKPVGSADFINYVAQISLGSVQTTLAELNKLGIGFFNYYTQLGSNFISTYNDNYVYGGLSINGSSATTTTSTTTTTTTAAPITTSTTTTTTTAAPTTTTTTTSTTTTTTTAAFYVLLAPIGGLSGTSSGACANYSSTRNYYSNVNFMQSGVTFIYEDSGFATPFDSGGQWKPMSFDGVIVYAVITDASGQVTNYTTC